MSLSTLIIRVTRLGASPEIIAAIVEEDEAAREAQKAAQRERKQRSRAAQRAAGVTSGHGPSRDRPHARVVNNSSKEEEKEREGTPYPQDWAPKAEHYEQAKAAGQGDDAVRHRAVLFRSHALDHDRRSHDWDAAFTSFLAVGLTMRAPNPRKSKETFHVGSSASQRPDRSVNHHAVPSSRLAAHAERQRDEKARRGTIDLDPGEWSHAHAV